MTDTRSSGRKTIDSYIKHEDMVDNAVKLGAKNGLKVEATTENDSRGDIKVAKEDSKKYLDLLGDTIDKNQARRNK
ncbi:hypothetical protein [Geminocystis herdmanii]|uniref:hypothetical protein n=1 Tax=Geminocystis herdmanii TaxID=669359 RepID=UPI00037687FC|nr:hypothetical protein [Geminocystis herdmanii]